MEWAFAGLNASLRDYARLGWLYLNGGRRDGVQIVLEARGSIFGPAPSTLVRHRSR
jgi:CubicO group peptidase (beta-lactamase class C family)